MIDDLENDSPSDVTKSPGKKARPKEAARPRTAPRKMFYDSDESGASDTGKGMRSV